jgi:hypothetical protein
MDSKKRKEIESLASEELKNISRLQDELSECSGNSNFYRRAKGSIIHDFYNACERIFELFAREIDGSISSEGQWHKKLLFQMTVKINDTRPAVISKKLAAELDDYLAFRHLFRNIYGFELESERLDRLVEKLPATISAFSVEINTFLKAL